MIVVLKNNTPKAQVDGFMQKLRERGFEVHVSKGESATVLGLIGDTSKVEPEEMLAYDFVESAQRVKAPYKQVSRSFHPEDTVVSVGGNSVGDGKSVCVMAGSLAA